MTQPLDRAIHRDLIDLLCRCFKATDRRALVENALYGGAVLDHIEWGGTDYAFSTHLLKQLTTHDREVDPGKPPLVALLEECGRVNRDEDTAKDIETLVATLNPMPKHVTWPGCPYPGLMAFTENEAPIFFGRQRDADQVIERLKAPECRFLCVVGDSGSGKSSLIAAGVIPTLKQGAIPGSDRWSFYRFAPGDDNDKKNPFLALAWSIKEITEALGFRPPEFAKKLEADVSLIGAVRDKALERAGGDTQLVFYMDQMEELFSIVDPAYQEAFIELVDYIVRQHGMRLLATLRSDFYPLCADNESLAELLRDSSFPLASPGAAAVYAMVKRPADAAGLSIEPRLVDKLLAVTGNEPGSLPLLAFALSRLWEECQDTGQLTLTAYKAIGGLDGAITQTADGVLNDLDDTVKSSLPLLFGQLVNIDAEGKASRKRADQQVIAALPGGEALRLALSGRDARLLFARGDATVEIAHEALLRSWSPMAAWIEAQRGDLRLMSQVKLAANEWIRCSKDINHLWPDERLAEVWQMLKRQGREVLEEPVKSFVYPNHVLCDALIRDDLSTEKRVNIGDRLAKLGDPRKGVGSTADGLPDIDWVAIPGGKVILEDNAGTFDVEPFHIARYPVTYAQYKVFVQAQDGYANTEWWDDLQQKSAVGEQYRDHDNCPADNVSWYDAMAYCRWLSKKLGFQVQLPTEWQWQQAATGGNRRNTYPWGADWQANQCNTSETRLSRSSAVGVFVSGQTKHGVLDMAGSVLEWCLNKRDKPKIIQADTSDDWRVVRGGSWLSTQDYARCAYRDDSHPGSRDYDFGFRVCCESPIL